MRFRWFFLGYLLMFPLPIGRITLLPALGYALMLYAMLRLSRYEAAFEKAKKMLYVALSIGIVRLGIEVYLTAVGENTPAIMETFHTCISMADELIEAAVMFFVYIGVRRMGDQTDIKALVKHSSRNMAVMVVYLPTEIIIALLSAFVPQVFENFAVIKLYPFIIGFIWRVMNLWMIFTCFLGIADTAEEKAREKAEKAKEKTKRN